MATISCKWGNYLIQVVQLSHFKMEGFFNSSNTFSSLLNVAAYIIMSRRIGWCTQVMVCATHGDLAFMRTVTKSSNCCLCTLHNVAIMASELPNSKKLQHVHCHLLLTYLQYKAKWRKMTTPKWRDLHACSCLLSKWAANSFQFKLYMNTNHGFIASK